MIRANPAVRPDVTSDGPAVNPYAFIVGAPRSGTRLLGRLVGAHPDVAVIHEARFLPGWFRHRRGLTREGFVTPELVDRLAQFERFEQLRVEREDLERLVAERPGLTYSAFVSELFELHGRAVGKPLVIDKSPRYVRNIPTLHHLWPRARVVHLMRDGRDVALSVLGWRKVVERGELIATLPTYEEDPVATAALWWERLVRLGREDGAALGPDLYREVRYEALVADPAAELAGLCEFLGVPYDPGLLAANASRPPTPGLRDWRTQMEPARVEGFEAVAGDLLDELGYPRAFPDVGADARRRAAGLRERFGEATRRQGARLPRRRGRAVPVNPFVFVVGCPRSGTTLLGRIVDAHPEVAVVHEGRFAPDFFERRRGLTEDGLVTPELVHRLLEHPPFKHVAVERVQVERLAGGPDRLHYAEFVARLYELHGRAHGKRLVGDKTPHYVRSLPTIHQLWPGAKVVHLIRDGRDVTRSVLGWKKVTERGGSVARFPSFPDDPVSTVACWWDWLVRLGREDCAALGPELYHELRYESLVADPAGEARRLCEFLGVPYDERMLAFYEGRERDDAGLDAKKAWRRVTPGLRDWRSEMPAADVERFEAVAGPLLDELGYERGAGAPDRELRDHAERVRESFACELVERRRRRLPRAWLA